MELYIWYSYTSTLHGDPWVTVIVSTPEILEIKKKLRDLLREFSKRNCQKHRSSRECKEIINEMDKLLEEMNKLKHVLITSLQDKIVRVNP